MNILASSPPLPPTTHIHIHIWWSVVFSQLISGQINQRPYLQSICWEGAVGSRRHSNMLDNNRKWKDSTQTLQASHFTVHYVLSIQMSGQEDLFFLEQSTKNFLVLHVATCDYFISTDFHTSKYFKVVHPVFGRLNHWSAAYLLKAQHTPFLFILVHSCSTHQCPKIPKLPPSSRLMFHVTLPRRNNILFLTNEKLELMSNKTRCCSIKQTYSMWSDL